MTPRAITSGREVLCPHVEDHTAQPEGYLPWHAWAEEMSKTHRQRKCAGCGLYKIWEPKGGRGLTHPERTK